mmetsp:Transcript_33344/g.55151  ORF Transcript_33344/g.55151 Transcript_33344/m.55151 type:complete len:204 (+) Transcript_33344:36-647(+)|eukprot:CAMPEP_0119338986 /NCGR_PEP_ID=MMETSP1333-20130426/97320_1 /TAXON_ID=418940 /ORGANISM="Scyphosphaera apsteinii, Strain RCC1455" /LENGTH=203 /DNA_ID=CAMNT_0007350415 /DNA_START=30 /DNA_END=641 /DNA_ORIENTATION=-
MTSWEEVLSKARESGQEFYEVNGERQCGKDGCSLAAWHKGICLVSPVRGSRDRRQTSSLVIDWQSQTRCAKLETPKCGTDEKTPSKRAATSIRRLPHTVPASVDVSVGTSAAASNSLKQPSRAAVKAPNSVQAALLPAASNGEPRVEGQDGSAVSSVRKKRLQSDHFAFQDETDQSRPARPSARPRTSQSVGLMRTSMASSYF